MGMAASQARFLGITARKTNTEYEGQQVNQQRTALANQSANLFNQLLGLDVPIPPNKNDSKYTKTVYTFVDDAESVATINSIVNNPDTSSQYKKIVKYTTNEVQPKGYRNNISTIGSIITKLKDDGTLNHQIVVGTSQVGLSRLSTEETETKNSIYEAIKAEHIAGGETEEKAAQAAEKGTNNIYKYKDGDNEFFVNLDTKNLENCQTYNADGSLADIINIVEGTDGYYHVNSADGIALHVSDAMSTVDQAMIKKLKDSYTDIKDDTEFYKYTIGVQNYYIPKSQTEGDWYKLEPDSLKLLDLAYGYFVKDTEIEVEHECPASVTYDSSSRLQSILLDDGSIESHQISVNSVTDEDKYEDAMNQYRYDYAKYEKTVEDINAKTEKIQIQDRTLELRLKQLDTEQEALTQEMEAIKKVIDKNVETTFKTFA